MIKNPKNVLYFWLSLLTWRKQVECIAFEEGACVFHAVFVLVAYFAPLVYSPLVSRVMGSFRAMW